MTMLDDRTLNPLLARYFFENFNIQPKNDIVLDSIQAKSVSVVTKRRHQPDNVLLHQGALLLMSLTLLSVSHQSLSSLYSEIFIYFHGF